jgi:hypothetical protein
MARALLNEMQLSQYVHKYNDEKRMKDHIIEELTSFDEKLVERRDKFFSLVNKDVSGNESLEFVKEGQNNFEKISSHLKNEWGKFDKEKISRGLAVMVFVGVMLLPVFTIIRQHSIDPKALYLWDKEKKEITPVNLISSKWLQYLTILIPLGCALVF